MEDETLCLASIMNIKTAPLVALQPNRRMEKLLKDIDQLPAFVLFGTGPRLKEPGLRWAPSTFLANHGFPVVHGRTGRYSTLPEYPDVSGFAITLCGYGLTDCKTIPRPVPMRAVIEEHTYLFHLGLHQQFEDDEELFDTFDVGDGQSQKSIKLPSSLRLIMLCDDLIGHGILVQYLDRNGDVELVRFVARAEVHQRKPGAWSHCFGITGYEKPADTVVDADPVYDQRWLIT
ncbi:MAG: hypothetical protein Q9222_002632 [Ikaeria aurantiellina]